MNKPETNSDDRFDSELSSPVDHDYLSNLLDERLDTEAVAQMVEQQDFAKKLSSRLTRSIRALSSTSEWNAAALRAVHTEIRNLTMDVALLKRALASIGHVGVMERRKIERELIRELFPPSQRRPGVGLIVANVAKQPPRKVDCENRIHLCKAACCRIFNVGLTPTEVESERFEWDPHLPYSLLKNQYGCVHLKRGGCTCAIYSDRPRICQTYSCANDKRIWVDFEGMALNPDLERRLAALQVSTGQGPSLSSRLPEGSLTSPSSSTGAETVPSEERKVVHTGALHLGPTGNLPATDLVSNAGMQQNRKPSSKVEPPNFDELRELMVPLPSRKFTPKEK